MGITHSVLSIALGATVGLGAWAGASFIWGRVWHHGTLARELLASSGFSQEADSRLPIWLMARVGIGRTDVVGDSGSGTGDGSTIQQARLSLIEIGYVSATPNVKVVRPHGVRTMRELLLLLFCHAAYVSGSTAGEFCPRYDVPVFSRVLSELEDATIPVVNTPHYGVDESTISYTSFGELANLRLHLLWLLVRATWDIDRLFFPASAIECAEPLLCPECYNGSSARAFATNQSFNLPLFARTGPDGNWLLGCPSQHAQAPYLYPLAQTEQWGFALKSTAASPCTLVLHSLVHDRTPDEGVPWAVDMGFSHFMASHMMVVPSALSSFYKRCIEASGAPSSWASLFASPGENLVDVYRSTMDAARVAPRAVGNARCVLQPWGTNAVDTCTWCETLAVYGSDRAVSPFWCTAGVTILTQDPVLSLVARNAMTYTTAAQALIIQRILTEPPKDLWPTLTLVKPRHGQTWVEGSTNVTQIPLGRRDGCGAWRVGQRHQLEVTHHLDFFGLGTTTFRCKRCDQTADVSHGPALWERAVLIMTECT